VDDVAVYVTTTDGLTASYLFSQWPRLAAASKAQREDFFLTYSGIHWPQIDEDLSFEGMFAACKLCTPTASEDAVCYISK